VALVKGGVGTVPLTFFTPACSAVHPERSGDDGVHDDILPVGVIQAMFALSPLCTLLGTAASMMGALFTCTLQLAVDVAAPSPHASENVFTPEPSDGFEAVAFTEPDRAFPVENPVPTDVLAVPPQLHTMPMVMPGSADVGWHWSSALGAVAEPATHCQPVVHPFPVADIGFHVPALHDAADGCAGGCEHGCPFVPMP
jgi:hypothetical protein